MPKVTSTIARIVTKKFELLSLTPEKRLFKEPHKEYFVWHRFCIIGFSIAILERGQVQFLIIN
jgi:hypothetical protein